MPELAFRPRARIIRTIGDRLISGPEAAVIELVKNAHDADASFVKIIFVPPLTHGEGSIVVEDDGHGMTLNDVQTKWMEPATPDKVERSHSPKGRKLLGSKGIGRFAASRLGRYLELLSTASLQSKSGHRQTVRIPEIDWDLFNDTTYLADLRFPYAIVSPLNRTGIRLTISSLRDNWTEDRLQKLHIELRRLISPLAEAEADDFRIYLDLNRCTLASVGFDGSTIVNGKIGVPRDEDDRDRVLPFPLLKSCDYEVAGEFSDDGVFTGTMTIRRGGLKPEPISFNVPLDVERERNCGLVLVQLFIFDREQSAVQDSMRRAGFGDISAKQAREILDQISGVAIYRDTFRIRPYGDSDQDWLTLDTRRVQRPTFRIGHNQVAGIVVVDVERRSGLVERSSREGLEENEHFRRLRRLMLELLSQEIEPRRYLFRKKAGLDRGRGDTFETAYRSAKFDWARALVKNLPAKQRSSAVQILDEQSNKLTRQLEVLEEKQSVLEAKVTLGLIVGEVLHEGRKPVLLIQRESGRLGRWWSQLCDDTPEAIAYRQQAPAILRDLGQNADRLRHLFAMLEPLAGGKRGKETYYSANQVVADSVALFATELNDSGIRVTRQADPHVSDILGYRQDLTAALANLIDNSIYWLTYAKPADPEISIEVSPSKDGCVITVSDNGPGIPAEFREEVFDVGFSLKTKGTGLGLSIAREAIQRSGGTIDLVESPIGTKFAIKLPFRRS